ncbi:MAG: hypothetical protein RIC03_04415 [Cyclobacteriaceae bacterium]
MNISGLHISDKSVSAISLFKNETGNATAIQILKGEKLQEHISTNPAVLICVIGKAVFEDDNGAKKILKPGDYVNIEPKIRHWVLGVVNSQLLLIK